MQVQATLFKIPREYFENSDVFRETYLLDPKGKEVPHGHTDQQPLRLDGVDAEEFRCLLRAMIQEWASGFHFCISLILSQIWKGHALGRVGICHQVIIDVEDEKTPQVGAPEN